MPNPATRTGPLLVGIGGFGLGILATGTVAFFLGSINVQRNVNFTPNGNSTGVVLQLNGVTQQQIFTTACTNTGGLSKYPGPCIVRSPLSTTGALTGLSVECAGMNKSLTMSGGFVKSTTSAVGSNGVGFTGLIKTTVGTGAGIRVAVSSGANLIHWNPVDILKVQTTTSFPAGGIDCIVRATIHDEYGK